MKKDIDGIVRELAFDTVELEHFVKEHMHLMEQVNHLEAFKEQIKTALEFPISDFETFYNAVHTAVETLEGDKQNDKPNGK